MSTFNDDDLYKARQTTTTSPDTLSVAPVAAMNTMSRATTVSSFDSYSPPSTPIPASIAESEPAAPTSPRARLPRRTSEEFHRELSARRKAFRRMSRLDDDRVLIGTRVAEGHQNYVLMYNMLTGIRIAVGRVSAKIDRELVEDDFWAAHKLAFDV